MKQLAVETTLDSSEPEAWSEVLEGVLQGNVEAIVSLRDMKVHIAQPSQSASYIMGSNVNVEGVLMETHRMLGSDYKAVRTMQDVGKWLQKLRRNVVDVLQMEFENDLQYHFRL